MPKSKSLQTLLSEGHIIFYTTVLGRDILRNVIVSGYVTIYQANIFFVNMLFFVVDKATLRAG